MEKLLPAALGAVIGIAGLLLAQRLTGGGAEGAEAPGESADVEVVQNALDSANARAAELERENRRLKGDLAAAKRPEGETITAAPVEPEEEESEGAGSAVLKAMMEFGAQEARRKVDQEVAELAERLNLTEAQQEEVRAALLAKLEKQQAAGLLMMQGGASISDLAAADEDNFSEVDAAMAKILSPEQMEEYAAYAHQREEKRVEKKANEELDSLVALADLSEQQADQAWDLFVEVNAGEKPGEIPPDLTMEDFEGWIDDAIDNRLEGLESILNEEQLTAYRGSTEDFRSMIMALVSGGTGSE